MKTRKWTDQQLIEAVKQSYSIAQVLSCLGLRPTGGNYQAVPRRMKELNLDSQHFGGQSWNKGKIVGPSRPITDYLDGVIAIQSYKLKLRLIKEGILTYQCSSCYLIEWLGRPIPLELDHIDGNRNNNRLTNLRLLCPNCHALTPTYRAKNKRKVASVGVEPTNTFRYRV